MANRGGDVNDAKKPSDKPLNLGMLGCGLISHAHGRAAVKSENRIRFSACTSRREDVAKAWADEYGCDAFYTDYREMLAGEKLDGIVIATWPANHCEHITTALEAGIRYILCEKALTTSAADAFAIWQLTQRLDATVVEAFMYRHHPAITKANELVNAGALGRMDQIQGVFHMIDAEEGTTTPGEKSWRHRPDAGGGVLHDFICYPVDAANHFAKAIPVRVTASGELSEKFGTINRLYGQIEYANGVIASVASSRKSNFCQSFRIAGADAYLDVPIAWSIPGDVTLTRTESTSLLTQKTTEYPVPMTEQHDGRLTDLPVFKWQLENFSDVIRGQKRPRIALSASVVNAFVLDALEKSFRSGQMIELELPNEICTAYEETIYEQY